jgi:type II secretory pathway pseudopilin PulG
MKNHSKLYQIEQGRSRGFSTIELLMVMVVALVIAAFSIPGFNQVRRTLRISGDGRDLNGAINQSKLQAAADFTRARVYIDISANNPNTFHVDVWNKTGGAGGTGCWQEVNDFAHPCFVRTGTNPSTVQNLSPGVRFGFAGVGAPPLNTQGNGIQQAPPCEHTNGNGATIEGTACIVFNSRGIPINSPGNLAPTGNDAFYVTDNSVVYGMTVGPSGLSQVWATSANGTANWYRK